MSEESELYDDLLEMFSSPHSRKASFRKKVEASLAALGIKAEVEDFGRGPEMIGVWTVLHHREGIPVRERVKIPVETPPYSDEAIEAIVAYMKALPQ